KATASNSPSPPSRSATSRSLGNSRRPGRPAHQKQKYRKRPRREPVTAKPKAARPLDPPLRELRPPNRPARPNHTGTDTPKRPNRRAQALGRPPARPAHPTTPTTNTVTAADPIRVGPPAAPLRPADAGRLKAQTRRSGGPARAPDGIHGSG